jgi:hypothetical protein
VLELWGGQVRRDGLERGERVVFLGEMALFGLKLGGLAVLIVPRRELVGPRGGFGRGVHGLRQGQVLGRPRGDPRERLLELLGRDVRGEQPVDAGEKRGKTRVPGVRAGENRRRLLPLAAC